MRRGWAARLLVAQPLETRMQASRQKGQSKWAEQWSAAWWQWRGQLWWEECKGREIRQQLRSHLQQKQKQILMEQWKWIHWGWSKQIRLSHFRWWFLWMQCQQGCFQLNQSQIPMKYCHFLLFLQQIQKSLSQKWQQMFHWQEKCQCLQRLLQLCQLGILGHQCSHWRHFQRQIHFWLILRSLPSRIARPRQATPKRSDLQQSTSRDGRVQFPCEDRYQGPTSQQAGQPDWSLCIWASRFHH